MSDRAQEACNKTTECWLDINHDGPCKPEREPSAPVSDIGRTCPTCDGIKDGSSGRDCPTCKGTGIAPSEVAASQEGDAEFNVGKSNYFKAAQDISRYRFDPSFNLVEDTVRLAESAYQVGYAAARPTVDGPPIFSPVTDGTAVKVKFVDGGDIEQPPVTDEGPAYDTRALTELVENFERQYDRLQLEAGEYLGTGDAPMANWADTRSIDYLYCARELRAAIAAIRPLTEREVEILRLANEYRATIKAPYSDVTNAAWAVMDADEPLLTAVLADSPDGGAK